MTAHDRTTVRAEAMRIGGKKVTTDGVVPGGWGDQ